MKKLLVMMLVGGLCTFGCAKPGSGTAPRTRGVPPSGPKTPAESTNPSGTKALIDLSGPEEAVTVKQGEKTTVPLNVKRTDYKGDVNLTFEPQAGSELKVDSKGMAGGKDEATVTVDATKAKPGTYDVKVTGAGEGTELEKPATTSFKVTVTPAAAPKGTEKPPKGTEKPSKGTEKPGKTPDKEPK